MTSNILYVMIMVGIVTANLTLQPCDAKISSIKVFPSTGETIEWDLKDTFFEGAFLTYSMSPQQSLFQIQKPFAQLSSPKPHVEAINRVTATRALTEKGQRVWMNHFTFIEVELDTIDLFYSEGQQGDNSIPPQFSKKISVATGTSYLSCLGVDYLSKDLFILDCLDSQKLPFTNKLFVVDKLGNSKIFQNSNFNQYTINTRRISQSIVFTNKLGHEHTYFFRSTPAFATQYAGLDLSSLIEVFYIESDGTPRLQSVLDAPTLGVLFDVQDPQHFTFSLIDFKVFPNGLIYILTAKDGVYVMELEGNGEFKFIDRIYTSVDQAYEFDVDYLLQEDGTVQEVIVILYNDYIQVIEGKKAINTYILEFQASYPATIAISQQFLIVQSKGVTYLFSTEHEDFIHKETIEGAKGYIINPYETELIAITQIDSRRFSLTHGLLRFPSTNFTNTTLSTFTLIATDTFSQQCKVSINYKIFNSTDYSVQAIEELEIPNFIYDVPEPFFIEPLASGPNLNYVQLIQDEQFESTSVTAKITQLQEMLLESTSLPPSSSIIYSDVLILDAKDEKYALLLQTTDKNVTIYNCHIKNIYSARSQCIQYSSFASKTTLNLNNFVWWQQGLHIQHLTIEQGYYGVIRESKVNSTATIGEFSYPEDPLNKVTSVTVLKDRFYLVLGNRKQIDIRQTQAPYSIEYTITEIMIKYRGFVGNWNPQRIFGNRVHNSYLFFIANEDNVLIADYHAELTIIKTITLSKGTIDIAVGLESFFIVLKSSTVNLIQEYDLQNLNSIHLMKNAPLYWYTIQTPLQSDFCSDTGVLFVRAYDSKTAQTVILVYGPGKLLRDSLLRVIPLGSRIPDGTSLTMSTAGSNQMIFYVNTGTLQKVYSYFQYPVFTISPNFDAQTYFSIYSLRFQVSNYQDVQPATYYQTLSLINTQITVRVEQNILDYRPLNASKTEQNIDLLNDWFDGQVVELDIDCTQCDYRIKPIQTVQQIGSGTFNGYHIIDAAPLKGSRTLYLANKFNRRVLITDSENTQISSYSISLSLSDSDACDHITASEDGAYIFTTCKLNGRVVVHVAKCTTTGLLECHQFGSVQQIDGNVNVAQIEINGNYLFVLNSNPNRPKNYEGSLNVYKWSADAQSVTFQLTQQFDKTFFSAKTGYFSSFYLTTYKTGVLQYIKVLLLDSTKMLYGVDGSISTFGVITWMTQFQSLDLYVYINSAGQFVSPTSQFYQIKPVAASTFASKTLTTYTLITTDSSAHYTVQLAFDTTNVSTGAPISSKSILYVLNQYSKWSAMNKVTIGNDYAVIAYTDNTQVLLASYLLPATSVTGTPLIKFVGGTQAYFGYAQVSDFVSYIPANIAFPRLYANIYRDPEINESLLTTFYLNRNFQIYVYNPDGKVVEQQILLTLFNKFSSDVGHVLLKVAEGQQELEEISVWQKIKNWIW